MLPELHVVNFEELETTTDEVPFVRESFELLKEASNFLAAIADIRTEGQTDGLSRNHAIVIGHYARMIKLMKTLIRQIADGHGGDQQIAVSREFMDSVSTVMYLLGDPGDGGRYTSYVMGQPHRGARVPEGRPGTSRATQRRHAPDRGADQPLYRRDA